MRFSPRTIGMSLVGLASLMLLTGCPKPVPHPEPPVDTRTEGWGLRKLMPGEYPDMTLAWITRPGLEQALDKSLKFLQAPSSKDWYPSKNPGDTITHDQVQQTLMDIKGMIQRGVTPAEFQEALKTRYDVYTSVGYDDQGSVWFTGYYTPKYEASLTRTDEFKYPIYSRPTDLQTDPRTGKVLGEYPKRRELLASGRLKGLELLWFKKPIEPFMIQMQGSAQVKLTDGSIIYLGYAGSNGRDSRGLGTQLRDAGKIDPKHLSLPAVLAYFDAHPGELEESMLNNDRLSFQKIYTAAEQAEWPTGSLNVRVTSDRSIATDKDIFPRASLVFIDVPKAALTGALLPYQGFVLDQDTGGAIRAAGRADIYMGQDPDSEMRAGLEYAQGRMYYVFLKPEFVKPTLTTPMPTNPSIPAGSPMFPGAVAPGR